MFEIQIQNIYILRFTIVCACPTAKIELQLIIKTSTKIFSYYTKRKQHRHKNRYLSYSGLKNAVFFRYKSIAPEQKFH